MWCLLLCLMVLRCLKFDLETGFLNGVVEVCLLFEGVFDDSE